MRKQKRVLASFRLSDTLRGELPVEPVSGEWRYCDAPEADQVYVVGNVFAATGHTAKRTNHVDDGDCDGRRCFKDTKQEKIRIVRQEPGSTTKQELYFDLGAIEKKKAEDVALLPNDIVDVPISWNQEPLNGSLIGGIGSTATQLPLRIVP